MTVRNNKLIDKDSLIGYLTLIIIIHRSKCFGKSYYARFGNYELLEGETLPSDATFLIDAVETKTTTYKDVEYEYYILKINQGRTNQSPVFS